MRKYILSLVIVLSGMKLVSQNTCDSLTTLKKKVYGFKPTRLSDSQRNLKNNDLDLFWHTAQNNPAAAANCLVELVANENQDSYFCYDASMLLLQLDTTGKYYESVISGLRKSNLEDLKLEPFLQASFFLGKKGLNISELAVKLISAKNGSVFLTNHVITLSAIDASIFLFNTMADETAEKILTSAILSGNANAKHNAAVLLNILSTDTGDKLLDSLISKKLLEKSTIEFIQKDRKTFVTKASGSEDRDRVLEALNDMPHNIDKNFFGFAGNDDLIGSACQQLTKQDIETIRMARSKATPALSDEALYEYFALTTILMTVKHKK